MTSLNQDCQVRPSPPIFTVAGNCEFLVDSYRRPKRSWGPPYSQYTGVAQPNWALLCLFKQTLCCKSLTWAVCPHIPGSAPSIPGSVMGLPPTAQLTSSCCLLNYNPFILSNPNCSSWWVTRLHNKTIRTYFILHCSFHSRAWAEGVVYLF